MSAPDAFREAVEQLAAKHASEMMASNQLTDLGMLLGYVPWQVGDLVVEIGTYHGELAVFLATVLRLVGCKHVPVVSIDPFELAEGGSAANPQGSFGVYRQTLARAKVADQCFAVATFSMQAVDLVPDDKAGLLIVDGHHSYEDCLAELTRYLPKLKPGGFVFVDDVVLRDYPGVVRAVEDYFADKPEWELRRTVTHAVARRPL